MNILLFVMSMLMVFTIMTYAKLDSYRNTAGVEGEFTRYMEMIERTYINNSADRMYDKVTFSRAASEPQKDLPDKATAPKEAPPPQPPPAPKGKSSGRLSLYPLINAEERAKNPQAYANTAALLKGLIDTLYAGHVEFQQLLQKHPQLVSSLLERISRVAEELPKGKKITKPTQLSNLKLGDDLDEALYMILKGCPGVKPPNDIKQVSDKAEDDADDSQEAEEFTSDKSTNSLLNFVDMHKSLKVNIYIASKPLLLTLYGDPAIVDKIIEKRFQLFRALTQKELNDTEASSRLKAEFQLGDDSSLLDYKVTRSDPRRYE